MLLQALPLQSLVACTCCIPVSWYKEYQELLSTGLVPFYVRWMLHGAEPYNAEHISKVPAPDSRG